jgi:hypothetical protein
VLQDFLTGEPFTTQRALELGEAADRRVERVTRAGAALAAAALRPFLRRRARRGARHVHGDVPQMMRAPNDMPNRLCPALCAAMS